MTYAISVNSDQLANPKRLIKVYTVREHNVWTKMFYREPRGASNEYTCLMEK